LSVQNFYIFNLVSIVTITWPVNFRVSNKISWT